MAAQQQTLAEWVTELNDTMFTQPDDEIALKAVNDVPRGIDLESLFAGGHVSPNGYFDYVGSDRSNGATADDKPLTEFLRTNGKIHLSITVEICYDKCVPEVILTGHATYQDISLQANIEPEWFSGLSMDLAFNGFAAVYEAECQCRDNPCSQKG